jgi:ATP-dependent protease HslVU (ClpYQ) peptidase subunit
VTTIAWQGNVIVGDSCCTESGAVISLAPKVHKLKSGVVVGYAGDADSRALHRLLEKVKKPADLPSVAKLRELKQDHAALVLFPSGKVFAIDVGSEKDSYCGVCEIVAKHYAIGSGGLVAMAAMAAGATAMKAVSIACDLDVHTRAPITFKQIDRKR